MIEDKIFNEEMGKVVRRYRDDYCLMEKVNPNIKCSMCRDTVATYQLRDELLVGLDQPSKAPYLYICKGCYYNLPTKGNEPLGPTNEELEGGINE